MNKHLPMDGYNSSQDLPPKSVQGSETVSFCTAKSASMAQQKGLLGRLEGKVAWVLHSFTTILSGCSSPQTQDFGVAFSPNHRGFCEGSLWGHHSQLFQEYASNDKTVPQTMAAMPNGSHSWQIYPWSPRDKSYEPLTSSFKMEALIQEKAKIANPSRWKMGVFLATVWVQQFCQQILVELPKQLDWLTSNTTMLGLSEDREPHSMHWFVITFHVKNAMCPIYIYTLYIFCGGYASPFSDTPSTHSVASQLWAVNVDCIPACSTVELYIYGHFQDEALTK